jgi:hypothetical protein
MWFLGFCPTTYLLSYHSPVTFLLILVLCRYSFLYKKSFSFVSIFLISNVISLFYLVSTLINGHRIHPSFWAQAALTQLIAIYFHHNISCDLICKTRFHMTMFIEEKNDIWTLHVILTTLIKFDMVTITI